MELSRRRLLWLTTAAASGLAGCSTAADSDDGPTSRTHPSPNDSPTESTTIAGEPVERLVTGQTAFGLDLLNHLAAKKPNENQFLSPYSIEVALAMTYAGAAGRTRDEMAETLAFHPRDRSLHPTFQRLRRQLGTGPDSATSTPTPATPTETTSTTNESTTDKTIQTEQGTPFTFVGANSLWGQHGFPWHDAFLETLEQYYGAGLHEVDFEKDHQQARRRINDWVAAQTQDTIPELFPRRSLSRATRLVLTNAVYFKANWAEDFPKEQTERRRFTALDGTESTVPMMGREEAELPYASVDGHQFVELPYAGENFGMVVILPEAGRFREFTRQLSASRLQEYFASLQEDVGTVRLPKFEFGSDLGLAEALADLGMPTAFTPEANFESMVDGDAGDALALDDVRHETYVHVDEHGTVASAATGVEVVWTSATIARNPFEMVVDRPFLFCVRHRETDLPVFIGRVADAAAAQPES